jgi:anti-sigma factor RsiW
MITRDNYEEFFLLYTDNELSAAERHGVERFITDHPDLREEWEALLQTKLSPDSHVAFPDRSALLKPEIEGSAWTGDLLSYIDGELDEQHTARMESALRQYPLVEREWAILRQTVSQPDMTIVFPEKDRLYKAEKDRRIIALPWLRAGIAAAVAGTMALLLLLPSDKKSDKPAPIVAKLRDSPATMQKIIPTVTPEPIAPLHSMEGQTDTHKDQPAKQLIQRRESPQSRDVALGNTRDVAVENTRDAAAENRGNVSPAVTREKVDPVTEIHETSPVTAATIGTVPPAEDLATNIHLAVQTGIPKEQSSFATEALQEEANDQRNNIFVTDESPAPGRGALRGIFRKMKRALGKTAERDSDGNRQVLVGAFQVSLD